MTTIGMTCEQLAAIAAAYLEGDLAPGQRAAADAHLAQCADCTALVADLRRIETEARALPELAPSKDLWDGIAARIEAPVIALPPARAAASDAPRRRSQWLRLAMAAAALVLLTAGLTYVITARSLAHGAPGGTQISSIPMPTPGDLPVIPEPAAPARPEAPGTQDAGRRTQLQSQSPRPEARGPRPAVRNVSGVPALEPIPGHVAELTYAREIAKLEDMVARRRGMLDSTTVAVLARNFAVIDQAIAESRAALAQDPSSAFLNDQLKTVLERKLELLRTAATLPARS